MSSLRINHHSRAIGAVGSSGETGRPDTPTGGASFAAALGTAGLGLAQKENPNMPLSGGADDPTSGTTASRKRADSHAKPQQDAATATVQGEAAAALGPIDIPTPAAPIPPGAGSFDPSAPLRSVEPAGGGATNTLGLLPGSMPPRTSPFTVAEAAGASTPRAAASSTPGHVAKDAATAPLSSSQPAAATSSVASPAAEVYASSGFSPMPLSGANSGAAKAITPSRAPAGASDYLPVGSQTADAAPSQAMDGGSTSPARPNPDAAAALPAFGAALPAAVQGQMARGQQGDDPATFRIAERGRVGPPAASDGGNAAAPVLPIGASVSAATTSAADPSTGASIPDQISGQLVQLASSGSREMVMRLHPPELGEVSVRIAVSGRDVSAWFGSPQPQVQTAISAAIGQLQTDLGNAGYNLSGAWVGADASGARQQNSALPQAPDRSPTAPARLNPPSVAASWTASSGVNIYV